MNLRGDRHKARLCAAPVRRAAILGLAVGLAGLLAGCAGGSGPVDAYKQLTHVDYGKRYIGMSKAEVLQCAGQPRSVLPAGGGAETLVYRYNGAGPVPGGTGGGSEDDKKKKKKKGGLLDTGSSTAADGDCSASLTFENGRLIRVHYAHKDARSPYAWQSEDDPKKREEMRREGDGPTCTFSLPRCPR